MRKKPRTRISAGLTVLAIGASPSAWGQAPAGRPTPQSVPARPSAQSSGAPSPRLWGGTAYGDIESGAPIQPWGATGQGATGDGAAVPGGAGGMGGFGSNAPGGAANAPGTGAGGGMGTGTGAGANAGTGAGAGAGTGANAGTGAGGGAGGMADAAASAGLGGALGGGGGSYFGMLGDAPPQSHLNILARPPQPPPLPKPGVPPGPPRFPAVGRSVTAAVLPSVQQLKISENQSPQPQDRIYGTFNYFDNLNQKVNERLGSSIDQVKVYRYVAGFEKTFLEGQASFGMRLPIDNLTSSSRLPGYGGTSTAVGDLAAIFKYAFYQNRDTGGLASAGLQLSFPTGPNRFAGARGFNAFRDTSFTPYVGFYMPRGNMYLHGFSSLEIPTDQNAYTVLYNDLGVGYFVYKAPEPNRFLSAVAPTFEVHVNTPLSHRGQGGPGNALNGAYDWVDLTFGTNFVLAKRGVLTLGIVEPVTGPRPFTLEAICQFNLRF